MAEVKMDLAELDKMRQEIKDKTEKVKELEKLNTEIKVDKRVVVKRRPPTKNDFTYSIDTYRAEHMRRGGRSTEEILKQCIEIHPLINLQGTSTEFINFEDVKIELRKSLDEEYKTELADLRHTKKMLDERLAQKDRDNTESKSSLIKEYEEHLKIKDGALKEWENKYKELETGKKELSKIEELEQEIKRLNEDLVKEQNKPWWRKIRLFKG